jgi:pimeloyl-ACP methyl ester carboxylesterase
VNTTTNVAIERLGPPQEPGLPSGFADVFESVLVSTPRLRHHAVVGGRGPALLLINGWPQTWYAWRHVLPVLAEHATVVAVEPRGSGRSDKPGDGYDTGSLAADLAAVMEALGHEEYAVLGHDVGMWIGFALAADHPGRVTRLAVTEAAIPGISADPAFFGSDGANDRAQPAPPAPRSCGAPGRPQLGQRGRRRRGCQSCPQATVEVYVAALTEGPEAL